MVGEVSEGLLAFDTIPRLADDLEYADQTHLLKCPAMKRVHSSCGCARLSEHALSQREALPQRLGFRSVGKSVGKSEIAKNFIGEMADTVSAKTVI